MAYIEGQYNPDDEEKQKGQDASQQPLQLSQGAPGAATGSAPAPTPPAGAGGAPAPSQDAGKAPGQYVNFQRYFDANRDAATASANKLASGIQAQGDAAQKELTQRQGTYGQAVGAGLGSAAIAPTALGGATNNQVTRGMPGATPASGARPTSTAPSSRGAAPATPAATPAQAPSAASGGWGAIFAKARPGAAPVAPAAAQQSDLPPVPNMPGMTPASTRGAPTTPAAIAANQATADSTPATYTGPDSLSQAPGWADLLGKVSHATSAANQTGTTSGLQALLQEQNKGMGADYGAGKSRFDAGLAGAAGGDQFAKLRQAFSGLPQKLTDADTASQAQSAAARGQVDSYDKAITAAQQAKADANKAAVDEGVARGPTAEAAQGPDIKSQISSLPDNLQDHSEKGGWNQVDFGAGFQWVPGFAGGPAQKNTDAGNFDDIARANGLSGNEAQAFYEKLSQDDIEELRWILHGPDGTGGATRHGATGVYNEDIAKLHPDWVYPDYRDLPQGSDYTAAVKDAEAKWFAKMQKKYGVG